MEGPLSLWGRGRGGNSAFAIALLLCKMDFFHFTFSHINKEPHVRTLIHCPHTSAKISMCPSTEQPSPVGKGV